MMTSSGDGYLQGGIQFLSIVLLTWLLIYNY